ncbi:MAG: electron transport complex subunit RsxG [Gammaproteobacteria bacterium]|nr:electron transport complex subunit RsxG [Gammaproteobacteria bacterium]
MARSAILLGLFAFVGTAIVVFTFKGTEKQILESEKQYLLKKLHALIKPEEYDNDLYTDTILINDNFLLKTPQPVTVYRARLAGKPVAAIFTTYALDGYNGTIKILVGIHENGSVTGARIIAHRETPGLGDAIDENKSNWITLFAGKTLTTPDIRHWRVKKEGGVFDQFTGATITPRAVIKAIHNALLYFNNNKKLLFSTENEPMKATRS